MTSTTELRLTSHVGRDLLSSAAPFTSDFSVVWEYVVNSLQYVDKDVAPHVVVNIFPRKNRIEVHDNASGMDAEKLSHFFTMHGENLERRQGRPGRGKFGTGKSAAFGIANVLKLDTRRNGLRNVVQLSRHAIESSGGEDIPVDWLVRNEQTDLPNGTSVHIEEIFAKKIQSSRVIEYVERHLQAFKASAPKVAVNDHICQFKEPEVTEKYVFSPEGHFNEILGDCELIVKVSRTPLEEPDRGISITAGEGNLVGREDAGIAAKEHGSQLFGEMDVLALESFETPIEPYDDSRSLRLNPEHPVVMVLIPFIGSKLEYVRKGLVKKYKAARQSEESRRLANAAEKIAEFLNDDFRRVTERLDEIRSAASKAGPATSVFGGLNSGDDEETSFVSGLDLPGVVERSTKNDAEREERKNTSPRPDPDVTSEGRPDPAGDETVSPRGGEGKKRKPRGGFKVDFDNLGEDENRSVYDPTSLKIIINLDHPSIANALKKGGVDDIAFKRLSYEVAFSEYAMALGYEMAQQDPDIPADDLLYEVRSTLNRVSKAAASLYSPF